MKVRTPFGTGTAIVTRYEIHHSTPADANLLLAVAEPLGEFRPPDTYLLIAGRDLPECNSSCVNRRTTPNPQTVEKIRDAVSRGAINPEHAQATETIILTGHFTKQNSPQYVVYIRFGDYPGYGYWRTVILDVDLSFVAVLAENEYAHIKPVSVGDIDGDGLDEIWTDLVGYEGRHAGIFYWRGTEGKQAFGGIATLYDGL